MKNFFLFKFILMLEQTQLPSCHDHSLIHSEFLNIKKEE